MPYPCAAGLPDALEVLPPGIEVGIIGILGERFEVIKRSPVLDPGADTELMEHGGDGLYEPLDLDIARCRLMTAGPVGWQATGARIRVATKFVNITRRHFARQGVHADLIKLYGAMELAPIMNLADLIVDIVDTGNTLRANGMEPLEEIASISSRLVVNKAAMRSRYTTIQRVIDDLTDIVQENARGVADATA